MVPAAPDHAAALHDGGVDPNNNINNPRDDTRRPPPLRLTPATRRRGRAAAAAPPPPDEDDGRLVVVAGATGHLGQEVCLALLRRRYRVLALCRPSASAAAVARLRHAGAQIFLAEATNPNSYAGVAVGAAAVVSCLGARHPSAGEKADKADRAPVADRGWGGGGPGDGGGNKVPSTPTATLTRPSSGTLGAHAPQSTLRSSSGPFAVDRDAVIALFREAREAGVPLFVAVGSLEGPATRGMADFIRAKEEAFDAVRRLAQGSATWWTVVRPGAMTKEFETMVAREVASKRAFTLVGDGSALFSPVTARDLAAFIADDVVGRAPRVDGGSVHGGAAQFAATGAAGSAASAVLNKDVTVAGPETLSYEEAVLQVADAVGVGRGNVRIRHAPPWLFRALAGALSCVGARAKAGVFRWLAYCMTHSMVGDVRVGRTTLSEAVSASWVARGGRSVGNSVRGAGSSGSGSSGSDGGRESPPPPDIA